MNTKIDLAKVRIRTERLLLTPIDFSHADDIFANFDVDVTHYMGPKPATVIDETNEFIKTSISKLVLGTDLTMAILEAEDLEFFGCAGLHEIGQKNPELGIWTKKSVHGNGYGLEAMTALIGWARANIDFEYLTYPVDKRNHASRRIPERNGGVVKREFKLVNQSGFELDEVEYWIPNIPQVNQDIPGNHT